MIEIKLKNLQDFKRIVEGQKTVYFKKTPHGFTYYLLSEHAGEGIINVFASEHPLNFNEDFNPELDGINIRFLVEIEEISPLWRVFYEQ